MKGHRFPVVALVLVASMLAVLVSACAAPTPQVVEKPVIQTQVVEKPVEKVVEKTVVVAPTAAPKGPVTLVFWHAYNDVSAENDMLTKTLIPSFEKANPGIKVQSLPVPYDGFRQKLLTSMAGGVAPDLIRSDIVWVPELADIGALAPLDQVMPDFGTFKDAVFPGPLSTNSYKNHYYGLPLDTNTRVWFWNKEMYAKAGLTAAPKTIDEVTAQCAKIKATNKDAFVFSDGGTYAWAVLPWIWSLGGSITDPGITKATGYLNGPKTVAAYEYWLKMYKDGCFSPAILGGGVGAGDGFATDVNANFLDGPWMYPIFAKQYPQKTLNAALMPAGEGGSISVVGGEDIVVMQQSQHKEEALKFLRFTQSEEYQLKMAEVGQMPVLTKLLDNPAMKNHPYYGIFLEQLKTAKARTPHPAWTKMDEIMTTAGQAILHGDKPVQKALDDAAKQIDALLATK